VGALRCSVGKQRSSPRIVEQENASIVSSTLFEGSECSSEPVNIYLLQPICSKTEYAAHDLGDYLK
jgi:hypothetical protein